MCINTEFFPKKQALTTSKSGILIFRYVVQLISPEQYGITHIL